MQLDFMRRCTQFLPLSSLQYHFSEEILHTPLSTRRGRVGGGEGLLHARQTPLLFSIFSHQISTFRVLDEKLAGVNEIFAFEQIQPQPSVFLSRHLPYSWEKRLQFPSLPSSAHFQPSSSTFLYRSSTLLVCTFSNHHQIPAGVFPSCSSTKSTKSYLLLIVLIIFFSVHLFGSQQAGPQA